jgi:hypothetical protein
MPATVPRTTTICPIQLVGRLQPPYDASPDQTETSIRPFAVLYLACTVVYMIPGTAILGAILLTGYLGGAEAIQLRVSDNGLLLQSLPVFCGVLVWAGIWFRDER